MADTSRWRWSAVLRKRDRAVADRGVEFGLDRVFRYQPEYWRVGLTMVFPNQAALADVDRLNASGSGIYSERPGPGLGAVLGGVVGVRAVLDDAGALASEHAAAQHRRTGVQRLTRPTETPDMARVTRPTLALRRLVAVRGQSPRSRRRGRRAPATGHGFDGTLRLG
jgi:hypothetical protein